jgi:ankyrin repeat protein
MPNIEKVTAIYNSNPDCLWENRRGLYPIHVTVVENYLDCLRFFLAHQDPDVCDDNGNTSLHLASRLNNIEAVKLLVEAGANIAAKGLYGMTPIHIAAEYNNATILAFLIEKCREKYTVQFKQLPELCIRCVRGWPPLYYSISVDSTECMKILLDAGADPNSVGAVSFTMLQMAIKHEYRHCAKMLIRYGADVNLTYSTNEPPLASAIQEKCPMIIRMLFRAGASTENVDIAMNWYAEKLFLLLYGIYIHRQFSDLSLYDRLVWRSVGKYLGKPNMLYNMV